MGIRAGRREEGQEGEGGPRRRVRGNECREVKCQSRESDETEGWIREKPREEVGRRKGRAKWGEGVRRERKEGKMEQKDKKRPALLSGPWSIGIHLQHCRENPSFPLTHIPTVCANHFYLLTSLHTILLPFTDPAPITDL